MAAEVQISTRIYRIVHIDNLRLILQQGGLWCGNEVVKRNLPYTAIGNVDLTVSRARTLVTCGTRGSLNDYVPFYFCPRSVMLYLIDRRHPSTYGGGQEPVVHLISSVERLLDAALPFVFTDRHAYVSTRNEFDDVNRLAELDWTTIRSNVWHNTRDDPDRQERKMAELLVHHFVPWNCIIGIGVFSQKYKDEAEKTLAEFSDPTPVKIKQNWYY